MYYRRKILLGILESFGGSMSHTKLQKVLFLVTRKQDAKSFDFVPYKYGSFSFQANQDLTTLSKKGFVQSESKANAESSASKWVLETEESFFHALKKEDQSAIKQTQSEISEFSQQ
jgi:uncharacterized protein YwgA